MKKTHLAVMLITILSLTLGATTYIVLNSIRSNDAGELRYTYRIVNVYPHNTDAFTEGLSFDNGKLYEGTGLYGESKLRCVELDTGNITQRYSLPDSYFGEGITVLDDKIIQLTWHENTGFVYTKDSFSLINQFHYPTEGWGITTDGKQLIMSDGTATLHFLDPETFNETGTVEVHDVSGPVREINELEYVKGDVYANVFGQERIAIIDTQTGQVKAWVDVTGLRSPTDSDVNDVLNGIAYDAAGGRLFVTGKRWSQLYEITLVPAK